MKKYLPWILLIIFSCFCLGVTKLIIDLNLSVNELRHDVTNVKNDVIKLEPAVRTFIEREPEKRSEIQEIIGRIKKIESILYE